MEKLNLNDDRVYYGNEAGRQYMSVSQYKSFISCEARAVALLNGQWEQAMNSQALLLGNYVHSYFESEEAHKQFIEENKEQILSKRKPYAPLKAYEQADVMIQSLEQEPLFQYLWQGQHEKVITGNYAGVEWKGKIDLLNVDKGYFVDLKTTADMYKRFFNEKYGTYVSFIEHYGYVLQMAVYEQLLEMEYGKPFTGYIYAVSKEDIPQLAAIEIEEEKKEFELRLLSETIDHIQAVKIGEEEPKMCGKCDYCKTQNKLDGFVTTAQLIG